MLAGKDVTNFEQMDERTVVHLYAQDVPETPEEPKKSELELLIERIQKIQQELPAHNYDLSPEEQAFNQAAREQREQLGYGRLAGRSQLTRMGGY